MGVGSYENPCWVLIIPTKIFLGFGVFILSGLLWVYFNPRLDSLSSNAESK